MRTRELPSALAAAFRSPTAKQEEAYGRFAHTLAAAAVIGAVTVLFSGVQLGFGGAMRLAGLVLCGLVFFAIGAVLIKGE